MNEKENKVRFGLKNVHYAILTESESGCTWDTPVHVPGAKALTMDPNTSSNEYKADDITYYTSYANNGYDGDLEMTLITEQMLKDVWGMEVDSDGVLIERSGVQPKPFALLFEFTGDQEKQLNLFYKVVPQGKPPVSSSTVEESPDPVTQSVPIRAYPLEIGSDAQIDLIKARTTKDTSAAVRASWYTTVHTPTSKDE